MEVLSENVNMAFMLLHIEVGKLEETTDENTRNYENVLSVLKTVTELVKQEERNYVMSHHLFDVKKILKTPNYIEQIIDLNSEVFRFFRNFVASSRTNQETVASIKGLIEEVLQIINCCQNLYEEGSLHNASHLLCIRCGIQFLGNLVVNNVKNKSLIWSHVHSCFKDLLTIEDVITKKYVTMLIYNCLTDCSANQILLLEDFNTVSLVVNSTIQDDSEWGLYIIENLFGSQNFFLNCYEKLGKPEISFILDCLIESLTRSEKNIHRENILYLAKLFEISADIVLRKQESSDLDVDVIEVIKVLQVLCLGSTFKVFQAHLPSSLLCTSINLLNCIHLTGKESPNYFSIDERVISVKLQEQENGHHPAFGFKRDLIRLIGNMCYLNKSNQDKMREWDGIPLLLDCSRIDAKNPFITQWVILAIRNLCERNTENQALIANMEKKGLIPSSYLEECNIRIVPSELNQLHSKLNPSSNKSRSEATLEEINDLFS